MNFHLTPLSTGLSWQHLTIDKENRRLIDELINWLRLPPRVSRDFRRKTKPGFLVLFYGSAGTDKSLAAALIGRETGKLVYRVDLSGLVSKYIGETEKNLATVFKDAEETGSVLFFDEADALFGKRTGVKDVHDRYVNMEAALLMQKIEDYPGLIILATNKKNNIDVAFIRRFQVLIQFGLLKSENKKSGKNW